MSKKITLFEKANLQVTLVSSRTEADIVIDGCGAIPRWTLVVNGARHQSIEAFMRAYGGGTLKVVLGKIGTSVDLADWSNHDAVLMAESYDPFNKAMDELKGV